MGLGRFPGAIGSFIQGGEQGMEKAQDLERQRLQNTYYQNAAVNPALRANQVDQYAYNKFSAPRAGAAPAYQPLRDVFAEKLHGLFGSDANKHAAGPASQATVPGQSNVAQSAPAPESSSASAGGQIGGGTGQQQADDSWKMENYQTGGGMYANGGGVTRPEGINPMTGIKPKKPRNMPPRNTEASPGGQGVPSFADGGSPDDAPQSKFSQVMGKVGDFLTASPQQKAEGAARQITEANLHAAQQRQHFWTPAASKGAQDQEDQDVDTARSQFMETLPDNFGAAPQQGAAPAAAPAPAVPAAPPGDAPPPGIRPKGATPPTGGSGPGAAQVSSRTKVATSTTPGTAAVDGTAQPGQPTGNFDFSKLNIDQSQVPSVDPTEWDEMKKDAVAQMVGHGMNPLEAHVKADDQVSDYQHRQFLQLMQQGIALDRSGNKQGAMAAIKAAYQYMPNGHDVQLGLDQRSNNIIGFTHDMKTGQPSGAHLLDQANLNGLLSTYSDPNSFRKELADYQNMEMRKREYEEVVRPGAESQRQLNKGHYDYFEGANPTKLMAAEMRMRYGPGGKQPPLDPRLETQLNASIMDPRENAEAKEITGAALARHGMDWPTQMRIMGMVQKMYSYPPGTARDQYAQANGLTPAGGAPLGIPSRDNGAMYDAMYSGYSGPDYSQGTRARQ